MKQQPTQAAIAVTVTLVFAATALAGCMDAFQEFDRCPEAREPGTGDQPFAGWELKVLTHGAWSWTYDAVRPAFENDTGAKLTQIEAEDAGSALQQAVLNKGNPVADVVWGVDNALFWTAKEEGIYHPYTSPNADRIHDYVNVDQFKDENGDFLATPADQGYINVNYDQRLHDEYDESELFDDLRDLAKPEWASEFVTMDPRTSSPGLGFLIVTVATFGETGEYTYKDYWQDLFDNGVLITTGWTEAYGYRYSANQFGYEGAQLDKEIVTSYTTSPAAEAYYGGFEPPAAVSFEPADGVFHQIETAGILKCTQNVELAKVFIDYVLTPEFQQTIPDTQAIYPIIEGVDMPAEYNEYATPPEDLDTADFTAQDLGENLERWVQEWETLFEAHYA